MFLHFLSSVQIYRQLIPHMCLLLFYLLVRFERVFRIQVQYELNKQVYEFLLFLLRKQKYFRTVSIKKHQHHTSHVEEKLFSMRYDV